MILYGADEALKWQMRVSRFLQAARYKHLQLADLLVDKHSSLKKSLSYT